VGHGVPGGHDELEGANRARFRGAVLHAFQYVDLAARFTGVPVAKRRELEFFAESFSTNECIQHRSI
jgi:hypothetical protein